MGQAQQKRRAVLIVEDDAELRSLTAALFEDEQVETIECESAEAALATLLIGGREVAMIFADVRLRGVMDGIDLAREVKMRWPLLPCSSLRDIRASASVNSRPASLTCPSRGSRSTCWSPSNRHWHLGCDDTWRQPASRLTVTRSAARRRNSHNGRYGIPTDREAPSGRTLFHH
jgi:CheY-like chemotaxis protein